LRTPCTQQNHSLLPLPLCLLQTAMYSLPVLVLLCVPPALLSSRHFPPDDAPTFQRDSVEWIPSYEKPNQRSSLRYSMTEHVFGTRSLPLRAAVESVPRHTASYRWVVHCQHNFGKECEPLLHDVQCKAHLIICLEDTKGRYRYSYTLSLTSAIGGGGWWTSRPRPLYSREVDTLPIVKKGGWAPRAGLDGCVKSRPYQDSIPPTVQPVARRFTDWAISSHSIMV
jgi:hypothetical protein